MQPLRRNVAQIAERGGARHAPADTTALWRVSGFQWEQVVVPGERYDWDNRARDAGQVQVVQLRVDPVDGPW